jgi:transcription initiation factor TFIIE subunit alpha
VAKFFGGEDGVKIVQALEKLGEATDEAVAAESGVKLNIVRKILYKMYTHGLISAIRARDEEKGWFIFYWKIQKDQLNAFIRDRKRKTLEKLKKRLEYEKLHEFFICEKCSDVRVSFEEAMESAFKCLNCGEQLKSFDNTRVIEFLIKKIQQLEDELKNE